MNASGIMSLAERASVVEDRTPDRLVELRERVSAARRRRRITVAVTSAAVVVIVLALSAALVTVDPIDRDPDPAPTPPPEPNQLAERPAVGTCWAVPVTSPIDFDYWYDDSPQVPCSEPHTTETVEVLTLADPAIEAAEEKAQDQCASQVAAYLGIGADSWIPWAWTALLPSEEQIADGASWLRCDVVFPSTWHWASVRETVGSAAGIADDPPIEHWACLDQPLASDQPFVRCDRPHRYEQTGRLAVLAGLDEYPTAQQRAVAEVQCDAGVPARLSEFTVKAFWDPRRDFVPGREVSAVCYLHDPAGGLLPAHRP